MADDEEAVQHVPLEDEGHTYKSKSVGEKVEVAAGLGRTKNKTRTKTKGMKKILTSARRKVKQRHLHQDQRGRKPRGANRRGEEVADVAEADEVSKSSLSILILGNTTAIECRIADRNLKVFAWRWDDIYL